MIITFELNGRRVEIDSIPHRRCVEVLREDFQCHSLRYRCTSINCGLCLILVDNNPVYSCILPAFELHDREIWTMEGLSTQTGFNDILNGFKASHIQLCSHCAPSRALSTESLLRHTLHPEKKQLTEAAASVSCHCASSSQIMRAMLDAATERRMRLE